MELSSLERLVYGFTNQKIQIKGNVPVYTCELLIRQRAHVGSTIGQQLYTILLVQQLYNSYEYLQFEPLVKITNE